MTKTYVKCVFNSAGYVNNVDINVVVRRNKPKLYNMKILKIEITQQTTVVGICRKDARDNVDRLFNAGEVYTVVDGDNVTPNHYLLIGNLIGHPDFTYYIPKDKSRVLERNV